jgi:hypothetical protein
MDKLSINQLMDDGYRRKNKSAQKDKFYFADNFPVNVMGV